MSISLRIAIAGTGRMGEAVEACAHARGHDIIARFNRKNPVTEAALERNPDVVIDFTQPEVALSHITKYCRTKTAAVIGTTGWEGKMEEVQHLIHAHQATMIYSSNYSLGIQMLIQALHAIGPLLDALPEFDVAVHESHHTAKLDSPSGTAISLAANLVENLQRKYRWGSSSTAYDSSRLEIVSTRLGHVFGQHRIMIDGPADHIVLEHTAKNRGGFALGAVRAAEWIQGRTGLFSMKDMLAEWLARSVDK